MQQPPEVPIIVVFAHANGFCKEVWDAVIADFTALAPASLRLRLRINALDLPGHGLTGTALDVEAEASTHAACRCL